MLQRVILLLCPYHSGTLTCGDSCWQRIHLGLSKGSASEAGFLCPVPASGWFAVRTPNWRLSRLLQGAQPPPS